MILIIYLLQYDYGGWMPNTPISLKLPPPTMKGKATEATMLSTFPDVNTTVQGMATMWLLSQQSSDFVSVQNLKTNYTVTFTVCTSCIKNTNKLKAFRAAKSILLTLNSSTL